METQNILALKNYKDKQHFTKNKRFLALFFFYYIWLKISYEYNAFPK